MTDPNDETTDELPRLTPAQIAYMKGLQGSSPPTPQDIGATGGLATPEQQAFMARQLGSAFPFPPPGKANPLASESPSDLAYMVDSNFITRGEMDTELQRRTQEQQDDARHHPWRARVVGIAIAALVIVAVVVAVRT